MRVWGAVTLARFLNVVSQALIDTCVATGEPCTSADVEPSPVITAMHDEAAERSGRAAEQLRAFAL